MKRVYFHNDDDDVGNHHHDDDDDDNYGVDEMYTQTSSQELNRYYKATFIHLQTNHYPTFLKV